MPTTYRRASFKMVGTLRFAHPTSAAPDLVSCARTFSRDRLRHTGTTGKSFLIFRNRVNPGNQKYSAFVLTQIIGITPPVSPN